MRTTVELEPDTAAAVRALREEKGCDVSQAVNELVRRGMLAEPDRQPFVARSQPLGLRVDVSDVAAAVDLLEGPEAR